MIKLNNSTRYNQLAIELLKEIFNGHYKSGEKIPSTRELAKQAGVNPNTMQMALQVLQSEGVLTTQSTTGRFVTTDIQHLKNVRSNILEWLENAYQKERQSYGNYFEKEIK